MEGHTEHPLDTHEKGKKYDALKIELDNLQARYEQLFNGRKRTTETNEVYKEVNGKLMGALKQSDELIQNLLREGSIAEESIAIADVLKENEKAFLETDKLLN